MQSHDYQDYSQSHLPPQPQRSSAEFPPLHHPVPQHVSSVPHLRSPPPPPAEVQIPLMYNTNNYGPTAHHHHHQQQQQQQQQQPYGGVPLAHAHPSSSIPPQFFVSDPTMQMGFQVGKTALFAGQEYLNQNMDKYVNMSVLKAFFNVSNSYVVNKLALVLFPWRHRPWLRQHRISSVRQEGFYLPPREDINSPDMYIPLMSMITYVLLSTLLAGLRGAFHPELLGSISGTALFVVLFEIFGLKVGCYIFNITSECQLLDLVAYGGYKFVGVIVTLGIAEIVNRGQGIGSIFGWVLFSYVYMANAFFLLRSLKYVFLPDNVSQPNSASGSYTLARSQRTRRTQFLFFYSYIAQLAFMWILVRMGDNITKR